MVSAEKDIEQSLYILLTTALGERVMVPDYGCDLNAYLFEPISNSKTFFIQDLISTAIINYEPRIDLISVQIDQKDYLNGIIRLQVDYSIRLTNTRFNLVFPFYKEEGTLLPQLYLKNSVISREEEIE